MALTSLTQDFIVKAGLVVQGTTSPVTTSTGNTGILQVNGSAAFAKDLLLGSTATIYGPSNLQNILNVAGDVNVGNGSFTIEALTGNTTATGFISASNYVTINAAGQSEGGQLVLGYAGIGGLTGQSNSTWNIDVDAANQLRFFSQNGSGTAKVAITIDETTGTVYTGADLQVQGTGDITNSNPALTVAGGAVFTKKVLVKSSTNATTTQTGALQVVGGTGIGQDLWVGGTSTLGANSPNYVNVFGGATGGNGVIRAGGEAGVGLVVGSGGTGNVIFNIGTSASEGTDTGFAIIAGGSNYLTATGSNNGTGVILGTQGSASDINITLQPTGAGNVIVTGANTPVDNLTTSSASVSIQAGGLYVNQNIWSDGNTRASTGKNGTLVLSNGGAYIGQNLVVMDTASNTGTNASNSIYVAGGVGIDGGLSVSGEAVFKNDVWFQGQTTYVNSTNTVFTDNLIELHVPPTGVDGQWTVDDGKDIGIRFHYYNGQDLNAAFVLADDTKYFEFYSNGTETTSTGVFVGETYATLKAGSMLLVDTTVSTDYQSGALIVSGGVGIDGNVYVNGKVSSTYLQATDLNIPGGIVFSDSQGNLTNVGGMTYNSGTNILTANVTTATNLRGGAIGQIPIQNADGSTTFIPAGTADSQVLTWVAGATTATWQSASGTTVGNSSEAANLSGGAQYEVPYQIATSSTSFDSNFEWHYDNYYLQLNGNLQLYGVNTNAPGNADTQIVATPGLGIELYSNSTGGYSQLDYAGNTLVVVNSTGAILSTQGGDSTLTLDNSGNLTLGGVSNSSAVFTAPYVDPTNLSTNEVSYYNGSYLVGSSNLTFDGTTLSVTSFKDTALVTLGGVVYNTDGSGTLGDSSGLTYNGAGTLTVGTSLNISGVAGDITMTGGSLTGVYNVDMSTYNGTLTLGASGSVVLNYGNTYTVPYINGSNQLVDDTTFTYNPTLGYGSTGLMEVTNIEVTGAQNASGTDAALRVANGGLYVAVGTIINGSGDVGAGPALDVPNGGANVGLALHFGTQLSGGAGVSGSQGNTSADVSITGGAYFGGDVWIASGTGADYSGNGSLAVDGGVSINQNITVFSTEPTLGGVNDLASIGTKGGAYIEKDLYVGTTATIGGDLAVTGNETITGFLSANGGATLSAATVTNALLVNSTSPTLGSASAGSIQTLGGVGIAKDLYVGTTATIGGDLNVNGTIFMQGVGLDTISSNTGTFVDVISTGTIYANKFIVSSTLDASLSSYGANLGSVSASIKTAGGIKALGNVAVGKILYTGMNDAGDVNGQEPINKTIDGVFITNSMQSGGTYNGFSGSTAKTIDTWDASVYTSAKYIVQIVDSGNIHTEEMMVIQDGISVYISQYGVITNNGELGTFDGSINSGNVVITFKPNNASSSMKVNVVRQSILTGEESYC
jgi:hypothetical protein